MDNIFLNVRPEANVTRHSEDAMPNEGQNIYKVDANTPGPGDSSTFKQFESNIIVGKEFTGPQNFTPYKDSDGKLQYNDNRNTGIFLYDSEGQSKGSVSAGDAGKIVKDMNKAK